LAEWDVLLAAGATFHEVRVAEAHLARLLEAPPALQHLPLVAKRAERPGHLDRAHLVALVEAEQRALDGEQRARLTCEQHVGRLLVAGEGELPVP